MTSAFPLAPGRLDTSRPFIPVRIAVLTVSDTRTLETDKSGATLVGRIDACGHILASRKILRDEKNLVETQLREWIASAEIDVVLTTGGTGLTGRDVTVEAHKAVYDKEIDGFGVLFHMISAGKIGTSTMQSRACAGVSSGTYLFALPGSPGACEDAWDGVLHTQLDNRHRPCNLVEILPRLLEG